MYFVPQLNEQLDKRSQNTPEMEIKLRLHF